MTLRVCLCVILLLSTATGLPHLGFRSSIVGGQDAPAGRWPWMVALQISDNDWTFVCGGSLINSEWVLSAAHCLTNFHLKEVWVGRLELDNPDPLDKPYYVRRVINHPGYHAEANFKHDLALVQLNESVELSRYVMPVPLPQSRDVFNTNSECWVTGWGAVAEDETLGGNKSLQEVQLHLVDDATCSVRYPGNTELQVCAGYLKGGKDSCQGDSGGPLVCKSFGRFVQVGVVSFGHGCARFGYPGVYTRVSRYTEFINHIIKKFSYIESSLLDM